MNRPGPRTLCPPCTLRGSGFTWSGKRFQKVGEPMKARDAPVPEQMNSPQQWRCEGIPRQHSTFRIRKVGARGPTRQFLNNGARIPGKCRFTLAMVPETSTPGRGYRMRQERGGKLGLENCGIAMAGWVKWFGPHWGFGKAAVKRDTPPQTNAHPAKCFVSNILRGTKTRPTRGTHS